MMIVSMGLFLLVASPMLIESRSLSTQQHQQQQQQYQHQQQPRGARRGNVLSASMHQKDVPEAYHRPNRALFLEGREDKGPLVTQSNEEEEELPKKKGLIVPDMGDMGPDGMPDMVVYYYAQPNQEVHDSKNGKTPILPNLGELDDVNTAKTVGDWRNRMRGSDGEEDPMFWSNNRDNVASKTGASKKSKSSKSKSSKSDKSATTAGCTSGGGGKSSKSAGAADCSDAEGGDDDDSGNDTGAGDGSGGDGGGDFVDGDNNGGGDDSTSGSNNNGGLCEAYKVSFTAPDSQSGEVSVVFLQGSDTDLEEQGVAALVEVFDPPVYLSASTGFAVELGFSIDTTKAASSDDKDGDGKFTEKDVSMTLNAAISTPVALEVAGCTDKAMEVAGDYYDANKVDKSGRKLEEFDTKLVVLEDWTCGKQNPKW
jgi:hypothetical protein